MVRISIITTVYNDAETILTCLESLKDQQGHVEHIIIDGESIDGTLEVIEEYKENITKIVS